MYILKHFHNLFEYFDKINIPRILFNDNEQSVWIKRIKIMNSASLIFEINTKKDLLDFKTKEKPNKLKNATHNLYYFFPKTTGKQTNKNAAKNIWTNNWMENVRGTRGSYMSGEHDFKYIGRTAEKLLTDCFND